MIHAGIREAWELTKVNVSLYIFAQIYPHRYALGLNLFRFTFSHVQSRTKVTHARYILNTPYWGIGASLTVFRWVQIAYAVGPTPILTCISSKIKKNQFFTGTSPRLSKNSG